MEAENFEPSLRRQGLSLIIIFFCLIGKARTGIMAPSITS
jgi:hypothetical protein